MKSIFSTTDALVFRCFLSLPAIFLLIVGIVGSYFSSEFNATPSQCALPSLLQGLNHICSISSKSRFIQIWIMCIFLMILVLLIPWYRNRNSTDLRSSIIESHNILFTNREKIIFIYFLWPLALIFIWLIFFLLFFSKSFNVIFFGNASHSDYVITVFSLVSIQIFLFCNFIAYIKYSLRKQIKGEK
jgi:hypothetical protein